MPSHFPGGTSRHPDSITETERLADRIASGLEPIPDDLTLPEAAELRDAIQSRLRIRLIRFLANAIAKDMDTIAQEKGNATEENV